ncbi:MAG: SPOR domain-containing protein [Bacteroidales bacterium]|nr:SPOR domain-containing protein [Bacteroidales bacterium]
MLNIQNIIIAYLEKKQKISLPGIGLIKYTYQPAEVLRFTRKILPPRYKIEFIELTNEPIDDFINFLKINHHFSEKEAHEIFNNFLTEIKKQLAESKTYKIPQIGTLKHVDNKIVFEEDKNSSLFAYNMGYKDISLPASAETSTLQSQTSTLAQSSVTPKNFRKSSGFPTFVKVGLISAAAIIVLFFVIANSNILKNFELTKVLTPIEHWIAEIPWFKKSESPHIEEIRQINRQALSIEQEKKANLDTNENKVMSEEKVESKQLVYHIIAGSFKNKENAMECQKELKQLGFTPNILSFNDTLFRVSLIAFPDRQRAVNEYIRITQTHPELKIWFYSRYE